jgi:hypothetical protein
MLDFKVEQNTVNRKLNKEGTYTIMLGLIVSVCGVLTSLPVNWASCMQSVNKSSCDLFSVQCTRSLKNPFSSICGNSPSAYCGCVHYFIPGSIYMQLRNFYIQNDSARGTSAASTYVFYICGIQERKLHPKVNFLIISIFCLKKILASDYVGSCLLSFFASLWHIVTSTWPR